jgi:hypothetical protein
MVMLRKVLIGLVWGMFAVSSMTTAAAAALAGTDTSGPTLQLQGWLCSGSGSSASSEDHSGFTKISFDGAGRFIAGSSPASNGTYRVVKEAVVLMFDDGGTGTARIHLRQGDGRITELMFDGRLYATGSCR